MLSCEQASFLITKSQYENLPLLKKIQLSMHLNMCKPCHIYEKESEYISKAIKTLTLKEEAIPTNKKLPEEVKEKIKIAMGKLNNNYFM